MAVAASSVTWTLESFPCSRPQGVRATPTMQTSRGSSGLAGRCVRAFLAAGEEGASWELMGGECAKANCLLQR